MRFPGFRSRKAKAIAALVTVAAVAGGSFWYVTAREASRPEVQVTTAMRTGITDSVIAVADIEASSRNTTTLSPSVKVTEVLVTEGQRVARGDVLAVLDTTEYAAQLEAQGITVAEAQATLQYLAGPNATMNNATAANAVSQASIALENARAAESAAQQYLADIPSFSADAVRQAEIAVDSARLNADAADANVASTRRLNDTAVAQAKIALDAAEDAKHKAVRDLTDLTDKLNAGLITPAEYDAQYPTLKFALVNAENACRSAQVSLDTAKATAAAALAGAEQATSEAELLLASAETTLDAAQRQADSEVEAAQRAVSDAQRAVASAEVALAGARSGASFARASDGQRAASQQSQIDLLDANIRYLLGKIDEGSLRAAVDGVVTRVDAVAGEYPQLGDAIVVDGTSGFVAAVDVPQADSVGINPGQRATVTLKGIGTVFRGSVASVASTAERSATSADTDPKVRVEVAILDPDETLRIGFEADVEVFRDDKEAALSIALDAVRSEPGTGNRYVLVLDDRNRATKVIVRTGIETGDQVEVLAGLTEGQRCVVNPAASLEGTVVRIRE